MKKKLMRSRPKDNKNWREIAARLGIEIITVMFYVVIG